MFAQFGPRKHGLHGSIIAGKPLRPHFKGCEIAMPNHFQPAMALDYGLMVPAGIPVVVVDGLANISHSLGTQPIERTRMIEAKPCLDREDRFSKAG